MNEKIAKKLKELPNKSGVYIMHSSDGTIIYVGKAKNLKNRVSSYFNKTLKPPKVMAMVEKVDWFEYIITPSELDAFTLENNLIKKEQPFYNILLKDSKTFPYIKLEEKSEYPRFVVTRRVEKDGGKYFGPYLAGVRASVILDFINKYFKLRNCSMSVFKNQKRECLNYELGLCLAPCTNRVSREEYLQAVEKAKEFLKGNDKFVIDDITNKMKQAAEKENFEKAIEYKTTLEMLKKLSNKSIANLPKKAYKDAIYYATNDLTSAISIVTMQNGRILAVQSFSIADASISAGEIIENFILSYYQHASIPNEIITNAQITNAEVIQEFFGKKVDFICSAKGVNAKLLKMAKDNAIEHLEKNVTRDKQKYDNTLGALKVLKEKLMLNNFPNRIECYDISNISGTNKVSSMVVFVGGEPKRSDYRKFKIKTVKGIDDFASLQETLRRRFRRLKEGDASFKEKPDLMIIDGGKGQLSSCLEIMQEEKIEGVDMVGLAKKLEEVFVPNNPVSIRLDHSTAALKLLQRVRDEAHRFAITFHRQKRSKAMLASELDGISGLGPKKKEELFKSLGDIEKIRSASIEQLCQLKGIDLALAHKIYKKLHEEI